LPSLRSCVPSGMIPPRVRCFFHALLPHYPPPVPSIAEERTVGTRRGIAGNARDLSARAQARSHVAGDGESPSSSEGKADGYAPPARRIAGLGLPVQRAGCRSHHQELGRTELDTRSASEASQRAAVRVVCERQGTIVTLSSCTVPSILTFLLTFRLTAARASVC
jgi:hypothetical protein